MTANRRHETRRARRDLRARGCTCRPALVQLLAAFVESIGAGYGATVAHQAGCVLGDRVLELNRQGRVPALFAETGCRR